MKKIVLYVHIALLLTARGAHTSISQTTAKPIRSIQIPLSGVVVVILCPGNISIIGQTVN